MAEAIELHNGPISIGISPEIGGGLAWFDLIYNDERLPVFRRWPGSGTTDPNDLACYPLVPWSNRISGGGFRVTDTFYPLEPNWTADPYPIHGNGWQSPWVVTAKTATSADLRFVSEGPGPFAFAAEMRYAIASDTLSITLSVEHQGADPLPYGIGLHPWLPRTTETRLTAPAKTVWLEGEGYLPTECVPIDTNPVWDFRSDRPLPEDWINNGFNDWDGSAEITWADRGLGLSVRTTAPYTRYIVYSPNSDADFFCFEPISHAANAHNLQGGPKEHGLVMLERGERLSATCHFTPRRL